MIHINQEQLYKSIAELQRLFLKGEEKQLVYEKFINQLELFIHCEFAFIGNLKTLNPRQQPKLDSWSHSKNEGNPYDVSACSVCNLNLNFKKSVTYQYDPPVTLRLLDISHPPINNLHTIPLRHNGTVQALLGIINRGEQYSEATVLELGSLFEALATIIYHYENKSFLPPTNLSTPDLASMRSASGGNRSSENQTSHTDTNSLEHTNQALAQEKRTHFSLLNLGLAGIAVIDIEGTFVEVNDHFCDLVGYKKSQLINHSWIEITHPADKAPDQYFFERVNACEIFHSTAEKRFIRSDKKSVSVIMTANRILDSNGKTSHFSVIVQDITKKNQAQEKFRLVFEQSSDPHFICDTEKIIDCNQAAVNILGCGSKEETLKIHPKKISPPTLNDEQQENTRRPMTYHGRHNGIHRFDWIYQNTKGKLISIEIMLNPVYIGNKPALLIVWHDITAIKETKELLTNATKITRETVRSKNRYLSSLSYQLRTHLNSIYCLNESLVESLQNDLTEADTLKLKTIQCSASQLIKLVDKIDEEAISDESEKEVFDIANTVNEVCSQANPASAPQNVQLLPAHKRGENLNVYGKKEVIKKIIQDILDTSTKSTDKGSDKGTVIVSLQKLIDNKIGQAVKVSFNNQDTPINAADTDSQQTDLSATSDVVTKQGGRLDGGTDQNSNHIDLYLPVFLENNHPPTH